VEEIPVQHNVPSLGRGIQCGAIILPVVERFGEKNRSVRSINLINHKDYLSMGDDILIEGLKNIDVIALSVEQARYV
jgi:hypothetical protein